MASVIRSANDEEGGPETADAEAGSSLIQALARDLARIGSRCCSTHATAMTLSNNEQVSTVASVITHEEEDQFDPEVPQLIPQLPCKECPGCVMRKLKTLHIAFPVALLSLLLMWWSQNTHLPTTPLAAASHKAVDAALTELRSAQQYAASPPLAPSRTPKQFPFPSPSTVYPLSIATVRRSRTIPVPAPPNPTSPPPYSPPRLAVVDRINARYNHWIPGSSRLEDIGVIVHGIDHTEDPRMPWAACPPDSSDCGFLSDRMSASLIWRAKGPAAFGGGGGVVLHPNFTRILCIYGGDGGTRGKLCNIADELAHGIAPGLTSEVTPSCTPGCVASLHDSWCDGQSAHSSWCDGKAWHMSEAARFLELDGSMTTYNEASEEPNPTSSPP